MSEHTFENVDINGVGLKASDGDFIQLDCRDGGWHRAYLPKDPAELHKLTEAIHGEPGDWVPHSAVYEALEEAPDGTLRIGHGPEACTGRVTENPQWLRNHAANALALARHIEARDAATVEADERVNAEAERLYRLYAEAHEGKSVGSLEVLSAVSRDAWRAVARDSLARQNGGGE